MEKRFLLVNDIQLHLELLGDQLRSLGFRELAFARDGAQALEMLRNGQFDLVLCDVNLPVIDGFQLCRLMRSQGNPLLRQLPILLMSASFDKKITRRQVEEVGAQGFLEWPTNADDLRAEIEHTLSPGESSEPPVPRVLVAEDEDAIAHAICAVLDSGGFEARPVRTGTEAIELGETWHPDIVITDYMMPGMNGDKVLEWYQRNQPRTPVIIVTAHGSERLAADLMRKGAFEYLAKPLELRAVVPLCRLAMRKQRSGTTPREQVQILSRLRRSEALFRALFEHGPPSLVVDREGKTQHINRRAEELLNRSRGEVLGRSCDAWSGDAALPAVGALLAGVDEKGGASAEDVEIPTGDDGAVRVDLSACAVEVGDTRVLLVLISGRASQGG